MSLVFISCLLDGLKSPLLCSVESLSRLHKKAKAFDIYLDDRRDSTTLRHVWSEVRDGVERGTREDILRCSHKLTAHKEAQSRQAFLSALTVDVINPILALKVRTSCKHLRWISHQFDIGNTRSDSEAYSRRHKGLNPSPSRLPRERPSSPQKNVHQEVSRS